MKRGGVCICCHQEFKSTKDQTICESCQFCSKYLHHQIGHLTPIKKVGPFKGPNTQFLCQCSCGNKVIRKASQLCLGLKVSCGCDYTMTGQTIEPRDDKSVFLHLVTGKYDLKIIVDKDKADDLMTKNWCIRHKPRQRQFYFYFNQGRQRISLHRYLCGITDKNDTRIVDHINHNTFDNRLKNLKLTDSSNNNYNSPELARHIMAGFFIAYPDLSIAEILSNKEFSQKVKTALAMI